MIRLGKGTPPGVKCRIVEKTKETRRLDKLKDESRNIAKTYKLPVAALKIIEKAGKIHGQQSRAIQVAVELLWHKVAILVSDATMQSILDSPVIGDLQAHASDGHAH